MFSWRRKMSASSALAFGAAGVCAVTAFVLVQAGSGRDTAAPAQTIRVVAAARDLPAGVTLAAADLTVVEIPASIAPPATFAEGDHVPALTTVTPFLTGEPVTATRLASAGGALTASVPPGMVAFTLAPDRMPADTGAGDRVDIYATYATARPYTAVVATDIEIVSTATGGGERSVTVIADSFTAQDLARADATATVAVAVRGFVPADLEPGG